MIFKTCLMLGLLGVAFAQAHTGNGISAAFGLGACGMTNNDSQLVVGVSKAFFNSFAGATANPDNNPICGQLIKANYQGKSVTASIVDTCAGCAEFDLNLSQATFSKLADPELGGIPVSWSVITAASPVPSVSVFTTPVPSAPVGIIPTSVHSVSVVTSPVASSPVVTTAAAASRGSTVSAPVVTTAAAASRGPTVSAPVVKTTVAASHDPTASVPAASAA